MVAMLPLFLAGAAWLTPGSLALRPESADGLNHAGQSAAIYVEAPPSAKASPLDATHGSLRTVLASGIANSTGLDPTVSGMAARVLLSYPLAMNPGMAISMSALSKGAQLVNLRSCMPDSVALLEDYHSKGLTLLESFANQGAPEDAEAIDLGDQGNALAVIMGSFMLMILVMILLVSLPLLITCCFVCCQKFSVNDKRPPFPETVPEEVSMAEAPHDFHEGIFSCISPGSTCLYAFLCPWARHADTLGAAGVMQYWIVILAFGFAGTIAGIGAEMAKTVGIAVEEETALQIVMALLFGWARQKLRAKFGAPSKGIVWTDFLYWWCCMPCSIGQEGMEVDRAQGVEVRCCCKLYDTSTGQLVGTPVKGGEED